VIQLPLDLRQSGVAFPFGREASDLWNNFRTVIGNTPVSRAGAYGIYCILNGKWYIGITGISVAKRLHQHRWSANGAGPKFRNALVKYGFDNFIVVPLFYCISDDTTELPYIELALISTYSSSGKTGFNTNLSAGIVGPYGPEFGAIMSAVRKEHFSDPDNLARHKVRQKKSHARPEVRAKLSASLTEYFASPEAREKDGAAVKQSHARPEVKANIANAQRKRFANPEARAATSAATKAAMARPEVFEKVSKASVETWKDPEVRQKRVSARRALSIVEWQDPEIRAKRIAGLKASWQNPEVRAKRLAGGKAVRTRDAAD